MSDCNPIEGGAIFNKSSGTDTSILAAAFTPPFDSAAIRWSITISSTDTTLAVDINNGTSTETCLLNAGASLGTGTMVTGVFGAAKKDSGGNTLTYTFKTGASTTVDYFLAEEIRAAVL